MDFPHEQALIVARHVMKQRAAVTKHICRTKCWPQEELAFTIASKAWESFNRGGFKPERGGTFKDWLYDVAYGDIEDINREAETIKKNKKGIAETYAHRERIDIARYRRRHERRGRRIDVMRIDPEKIPRRIVPLGRSGRTGYPANAYARAIEFRKEHGLEWRELRKRLVEDADFRQTIGFTVVPRVEAMCAAQRRIRRWMRVVVATSKAPAGE